MYVKDRYDNTPPDDNTPNYGISRNTFVETANDENLDLAKISHYII